MTVTPRTTGGTSPKPLPTSGGSDKLKPNTADLRVDHDLLLLLLLLKEVGNARLGESD